MNIKTHLLSLLKESGNYELSPFEKEYIKNHNIADSIYYFLTTKRRGFRKWSLNEEAISNIQNVIRKQVEKNLPIIFTYPFGGYKLHRIENNNQVAWSEYFAIAYIQQYLAPIAKIYEPGIEFYFWSDDYVIERVNNIPKETTDSYIASLRNLLEEFDRYNPENMKLGLKRVQEYYADDEYEKELAERVLVIEEKAKTMDPKRIERMKVTSELNVMWEGKEDWAHLTEAEKNEKIRMGMIYHDAECSLSRRTQFVRGEDKIVLFTTLVPNAIGIGTTKSSITKFWTGVGVLEVDGENIYEIVLSPKQWSNLKNNYNLIKDIDVISGDNFKDIYVINERINFVNAEH